MAKSDRDKRVDELVAMGEGVVTGMGPHTTCKNCGKPFGPNDAPEAIAFGWHREHPLPQGFWKGPHNDPNNVKNVS